MMFRVSSAHEEGGERVFSVNTEEFVGRDGHVAALKVHEVTMQDGKFVKTEGTDFEIDADLVLLAMGFVGPEQQGPADGVGRGVHRPWERRRAVPTSRRRCRVSSLPATPAAASR